MSGLGRSWRAVLLGYVPNAYAALSADDPGDTGSGLLEPTIGSAGYARQAITWAAVSTPIAGEDAILTNANTLTFTSTGVWNATRAFSNVAVMGASSGAYEGIYIGSCGLSPARLVDRAGIVITIPAGALTLSIGLTGG